MYGILYIQKVVLRSHYMRTETAIAPIKGLFYYHGEIMYKDSKLSFYQVDIKYMRYLLQNGIKVMGSSSIDKQNRKYIGIIIKNHSNQEYLIPLASPKPKHINMKNKLDFIKIEEGKLGVININNMIPVNPSVYTEIKIN